MIEQYLTDLIRKTEERTHRKPDKIICTTEGYKWIVRELDVNQGRFCPNLEFAYHSDGEISGIYGIPLEVVPSGTLGASEFAVCTTFRPEETAVYEFQGWETNFIIPDDPLENFRTEYITQWVAHDPTYRTAQEEQREREPQKGARLCAVIKEIKSRQKQKEEEISEEDFLTILNGGQN